MVEKIIVPKKFIVKTYNSNCNNNYKIIKSIKEYKNEKINQTDNYFIIENIPKTYKIIGAFEITASRYSNKSHFKVLCLEDNIVYGVKVETINRLLDKVNIINRTFDKKLVIKSGSGYIELYTEDEVDIIDKQSIHNKIKNIKKNIQTGDVVLLQYTSKKYDEIFTYFEELYVIEIDYKYNENYNREKTIIVKIIVKELKNVFVPIDFENNKIVRFSGFNIIKKRNLFNKKANITIIKRLKKEEIEKAFNDQNKTNKFIFMHMNKNSFKFPFEITYNPFWIDLKVKILNFEEFEVDVLRNKKTENVYIKKIIENIKEN